MNMDKYFMWIHYEWLHNHNKAKHNKTVYIFLGIYCIYQTVPQLQRQFSQTAFEVGVWMLWEVNHLSMRFRLG